MRSINSCHHTSSGIPWHTSLCMSLFLDFHEFLLGTAYRLLGWSQITMKINYIFNIRICFLYINFPPIFTWSGVFWFCFVFSGVGLLTSLLVTQDLPIMAQLRNLLYMFSWILNVMLFFSNTLQSGKSLRSNANKSNNIPSKNCLLFFSAVVRQHQ